MARPIAQESTFGNYRLGRRLARGGMAEVFRAEQHLASGVTRPVVIKRVLPSFASDPGFIEMFRNEAQIGLGLSHGNIVSIYDFGEVNGEHYLAMEYVNGVSLAQVLDRLARRGRLLSPVFVAFIVQEMCKGLYYAHTRTDEQGRPLNLVHRDISPQNVLISYEGQVKLTDFGIAKAYGLDERMAGRTHTASGVIKGKFSYFSPEQARGKPLDGQSDLFATGVLLYEALTGRLPFGNEYFQTLARLLRDECSRPSSINPALDAEIEQVVQKAKTVNKADRYATALELQVALSRYLATRAPDFHPQRLTQVLRHLFAPELRELGERVEASAEVARELDSWPAAPGDPDETPGERRPTTNPLTGTRYQAPSANDSKLAGAGDGDGDDAARVATDPGRPSPVVVVSPQLLSEVGRVQQLKLPDRAYPRLYVHKGPLQGGVWPLRQTVVTMGRSPECDVRLEHRSISWFHCVLEQQADESWRVTDLGASNGIRIDGMRLEFGQLAFGQELMLGHVATSLLPPLEPLPSLREQWRRWLPWWLGAALIVSLGLLVWRELTAPPEPPEANRPSPPTHSEPPWAHRPPGTPGQ